MWPNPQFLADLVTFTEEILNGKLRFFCSAITTQPFHSRSNCKKNFRSNFFILFLAGELCKTSTFRIFAGNKLSVELVNLFFWLPLWSWDCKWDQDLFFKKIFCLLILDKKIWKWLKKMMYQHPFAAAVSLKEIDLSFSVKTRWWTFRKLRIWDWFLDRTWSDTAQKKMKFSIRISSVNVTKSAFTEEILKVACVAKIKLFFMDWFYYNLIILIK